MKNIAPQQTNVMVWRRAWRTVAALTMLAGLAGLAQTTRAESGAPGPAADTAVIEVPSPLRDAEMNQLVSQYNTLDPALVHLVFDFAGAVAEPHVANRLAALIFHETRHTVGFVRGRMDGAMILPLLACHEIWMAPEAQIGPLAPAQLASAEWQSEASTFRSHQRSCADARAARAALWEKLSRPETPLFIQPGNPPVLSNAAMPGANVEKFPDLLVLVANDAARLGLASLAKGTTAAVSAAAKGWQAFVAGRAPAAAGQPAPSAAPKASAKRMPLPSAPQKAAIIPIDGTIDDGLTDHIRRSFEKVKEQNIKAVIFSINTPGGKISSMVDICGLIEDQHGKVLTVAWVAREAISAGVMIALACDYLAMRDSTTMGDCQPILMTDKGYEVAGEKIQTYLRARVTTYAERCGYPRALLQGMITQQIEVIEIQPISDNPADRTLMAERFDSRFVNRQDFETWQHKDRFRVLRVVKAGAKQSANVSDDGTVGTSIASGELLTLTDQQAREFGLALPTIHNWADLENLLYISPAKGGGDVVTFEAPWSVRLARFLEGISGILLILGFLGIFIEIKTPGMGLGALIAIVAFGLYFFSGAIGGLADSWEILLFVVGLVLLLIEIFVIPGFGITGISGIVLMLVGLLLAGQDFILPETVRQTDLFTRNIAGLLLSLFGAIVGIIIVARFLPRTPFLRRLFLESPDAAHVSATAVAVESGTLLGAIGEAVTDLRPVGKAKFGAAVLDVQAKGSFITVGSKVLVSEAQGNRIVVKPLEG